MGKTTTIEQIQKRANPKKTKKSKKKKKIKNGERKDTN